jgi:hypothetical protein
MKIPFVIATAILLSSTTIAAASSPPISEVGNILPPFGLADQFGKSHNLDEGVKVIYLDVDRKGDQLLNATLTEQGQAHLDEKHAIVISDISAAPSFVISLVISDLKGRHYNLWVDQQGSVTASLPRHSNQVTVIELDQRRITAIRYCDSVEQLRHELGF